MTNNLNQAHNLEYLKWAINLSIFYKIKRNDLKYGNRASLHVIICVEGGKKPAKECLDQQLNSWK